MGSNQRQLVLALGVLCVACGDTSPTPDSTSEPSVEPSAVVQSPGPLAAALDALSQPLSGADGVTSLQRQQQLCSEWLQAHPDHQDADAVRLVAGALSLTAHGAIAALSGQPPQEMGERSTVASLRALIQTMNDQGSKEASLLKEAALVLLGLDPQVRDVELNRASAMTLAQEPSPMGLVVRAVMLARLEASLRAMTTLPAELTAQSAIPLAGRVLCPRCADTHHMTPDKVTHLLLNSGNQGGIICDEALKAATTVVTPRDEIAALTLCASVRAKGEQVEGATLWSNNIIILGALRTIDDLAGAPQGDEPITPLVTAQIARIEALCAEPIMLPVPVVASPLKPGTGTPEWVMSIPELGSGGLSRAQVPPGVLILGRDELRVGLRPTVRMIDGAIESLSLAAGLPAGGRRIASIQDLTAADAGDRAKHVLASAVAEVWLARQDSKDKEAAPTQWKVPPVDLVVDAETPTELVTAVVSILKTMGANSLAFTKTATHGNLLHLLVRDASQAVLDTIDVGYQRPLTAVVYGDHVDLWRPSQPAGAPREPRKAKSLPSVLLPGYRGKDLERLRLMMPEGSDGLSLEALGHLRAGMDHFLRITGSGPLAHVIAGEGTRAADVLRVSRAFQERPGEPLEDPGAIWPGTSCGTPDHKRVKRTPTGCPTGVAVAFSSSPVPSSRGLSLSGPTPKGMHPSAKGGVCDKEDIERNMKKRTGSFKFCYDRERKASKDLEGRVVFRFTIGRDGKVQGEPQVASSTLKSPPVHQCLSKNIKKMSFSEPDGGACEVSWPFVFQLR